MSEESNYVLEYDSKFLKKHNNLYVEHCSVSDIVQPYTAPYMELVYIAHGKGFFYINNNDYEVFEGDVFLINPNIKSCVYSYPNDRSLSVYGCCFFPEALPFKLNNLKKDFPNLELFLSGHHSHIQVRDTKNKDIRNLVIHMLDDFLYPNSYNKYTVKSLLTLSVINLLKIHSAENTSETILNSNTIAGNVINYINHNIYSKIALNEISQILHVTPQHICRMFKKDTGKTFTEFVNEIRVEKIKDELENTDRPMILIYDEFDFTTKYINKIFFKYTGYTMQEYKNKFNYKVDNPLYKKEKNKRQKKV